MTTAQFCNPAPGNRTNMNPFTRTLEPVWMNPTSVWVDPLVVESTAQKIANDIFSSPVWREPVFPTDDDLFLDFIGIGNAINFAFTDFDTQQSFTVEFHGAQWRGAFAMWACLQRAIERGFDLLDGRILKEISFRDTQGIFAGMPCIPLIRERWEILREVGAVLQDRYRGRFRNFFRAEEEPRAFGNDGYVIRLLEDFRCFRDESLYQRTGDMLKFEKRAQLLAMMYQGRATSSVLLPELVDAADLGPIADYGVPRALHSLGILKYSPNLQERIKSGRLIAKDSLDEQEIRAQTVRAQTMLLERLNRIRSQEITFVQLDYRLWTLGRGTEEPHHLTVTTAY